MSENSANPFEGLPLHHLLFLKIRDGGGPSVAHGVAELHEITVQELKAHCLVAAKELIKERGSLLIYEQRVYEWAKS